jgi:hypothetical protein
MARPAGLWWALLFATVLLAGCATPEPIPYSSIEGIGTAQLDGPIHDVRRDRPAIPPPDSPDGLTYGQGDGVRDGGRDGGVRDGSAQDRKALDQRRDGGSG